MPEMIPVQKIAAAALRHVEAAADGVEDARYSTAKKEVVTVHLNVAAELLALISGPAEPGKTQGFLVGAPPVLTTKYRHSTDASDAIPEATPMTAANDENIDF